jgi:hypothetical protein
MYTRRAVTFVARENCNFTTPGMPYKYLAGGTVMDDELMVI